MKNIKYNLLFILDFLYIFIISVVFYFTLTIQSSRVIYIPTGSVNSIISYLSSTNYDLNILDNILLRIMGSPQKGWIDLEKNTQTKWDFIYKLTTSKAAIKTIQLTPGETQYFLLDQLSKELNLSRVLLQHYYDIYKYKEDGNILAESYNIPYGMSEKRVIFFLMDYSNTQYKKYSEKIFSYYDKEKWYRYLIVASIIQKEASSINEMPYIASVIYNRLDKNMRLQMDGTLNYGKYSHTKVTSKRIRNDKTNYNTYKIKGLPSNPVCAVSFDAIKAAIKPAKTNYLYFVKSPNSTRHIFTNSYKQHKQNVKKYANSKKYIKQKPSKNTQKATKSNKSTQKDEPKKSIKNLWQSVY